MRGLLNVIQGSSWDTRPDARILLYINMLAMFGAASQEIYIYHIDKGTFLFLLQAAKY